MPGLPTTGAPGIVLWSQFRSHFAGFSGETLAGALTEPLDRIRAADCCL